MSTAQAARRKDGGRRGEAKSDLYRSPHKAIVPVKMALSHVRNSRILDPCEGDGRIKNALRSPTNSVIGFDKYPSHGVPVDFLQHKGQYDYIVGNPPFSLKGPFIDHSLELSRYVIYILPMGAVSYNYFHRNYLDRPEYMGRLLMTPKFFMNAAGTFIPGGTDSYAWFFWDRQCKKRGSFEYYFDLSKLN